MYVCTRCNGGNSCLTFLQSSEPKYALLLDLNRCKESDWRQHAFFLKIYYNQVVTFCRPPSSHTILIRHQNCMAQCCASCINMAQWCALGISMALYAVHQASLILWHNIAQCCAGINLWPDAVHQASQYASNLCIMARCGTSMTQAVYHASLWLNTAWLITPNLPHHTLSTSFFFYFFCG